MGKKSRRQGPVKLAGSQDIRDLLLRPSRANGTFAPKENGDSLSASSEERIMDNELPSTKGDIKTLLRNIRQLFAADIAIVCEEIHTVEG
ncbi:Hypothetical predicted protein, partial [Pelobates cultripes]